MYNLANHKVTDNSLGCKPAKLEYNRTLNNVLFFCLFVCFFEEKNRCRRIDKQLDQAYFFPAEKKKNLA